MNYALVTQNKLKFPLKNLVVFTYSNHPLSDSSLSSKDKNKLGKILKTEGFKGTVAQIIKFNDITDKAQRLIAIGLGGNKEYSEEKLRRALSKLIDYSRIATIDDVTIELPKDINDERTHQVVIETLELGVYSFDRYISKPKRSNLKRVNIAVRSVYPRFKDVLKKARTYAESTNIVRDLVITPAMDATPKVMAGVAKEVSRKNRIQIKIYDEKQIERMKMGSFRAVSLGSSQPPRFVHMTYKPRKSKATICLVGKGITFDSGGLSLKPSNAMYGMKCDMAGAATVIGAVNGAAKLKVNVTVHGIFAATENMPGQSAYKLGDVLKAMNGKTIEVHNTDAEGRLVLADALAYASNIKPDYIIDMATLTGACIVALGPHIAGLYSNDDSLAKKLYYSGEKTGELLWRMPLVQDYFDEMMKSDIADMKNVGGRWGGSITAALFLQQFVGKGIKWAHLDIAGPAMPEKKRFYQPTHGSGMPTRALLDFMENIGR